MSEGEKDLTTKKREQKAVPKKKEQKLRKNEGTYLSPDGNQPAAPAAPDERTREEDHAKETARPERNHGKKT
jgi:hypothetical protein